MSVSAPGPTAGCPARGPAYVIRTRRLTLRCWDPSDAEKVSAAIVASDEHLRPWMPWVNDANDPESMYQRLRKFRADFDLGLNLIYGVFAEGEVGGGTGLHARVGHGALEIGYWVHVDHAGRGYATEIAEALTRVAFDIHGVRRVDILHAPGNEKSGAVPRKLGFMFEATLRSRLLLADGTNPDACVWTMLREEYEKLPVSRAPIEAKDGKGKSLLE